MQYIYRYITQSHQSHNQHTHTNNTRKPEPQLKSSSCSSAIPSHNSRNATCLTPIPSPYSMDMFRATTQRTPASRPLSYPRSLVDHTNHTSRI